MKAMTAADLIVAKRRAEERIADAIHSELTHFVSETGWTPSEILLSKRDVTNIDSTHREYIFCVHLDVRLDP